MVILGVLLAAAPSAAEGASIRITLSGAEAREVILTVGDLGEPDVDGISYPLREGETRSVTGWSLGKVLDVAAEMPDASDWLDVPNLPSVELVPPGAGSITVSSREIRNEGPFEGGRTPVFQTNQDDSFDFIKPGMDGSPGTLYRYSSVVTVIVPSNPTDYDRLQLTASERTVEKGDRIAFEVTVPGSKAAGLVFDWRFFPPGDGDVEVLSDESPLEKGFERIGRWKAQVLLPGFKAGTVSFSVVKEPGRPDDGGEDSDKPRPRPGGDPTGGSGGDPGTGGYGGSGPGSGFGQFPDAGSIGAPDSAPLPREAKDRSVAAKPDGLERVSGLLIDPAASASAAAPEAGGPEEADPVGDGAFGLSGEAATLLGVGLLIALGGLIEARILFRRF